MSLRKDVGSLLIVGLGGTSLSTTETAWLRLLQPTGVILFRRNLEDAAQTRALLADVGVAVTTPLFRCIDVEGGLVDRLRDLVAPMPSAAAVAATGRRKLATEHGILIGDELRMLGLNSTFAPVLDLALPASASVMRTRTAGVTAQSVIAYAQAFLSGLKKAGILGCGKHFPGLGAGALDSHHAMPEIDRGWQQLWDEDIAPYRKLHRRLPFIMVAHAAYPRVKQTSGAASVSKYWTSDILRKKIGYRGLILSDDLEMGGILNQHSIAEASVAAVLAGTHLLEICKEPALILEAYEALLSEAERSSAFRRKVERAADHVRRQRRRLLRQAPSAPVPTAAQLKCMQDRIGAFTQRVTLHGEQQAETLAGKRKRS